MSKEHLAKLDSQHLKLAAPGPSLIDARNLSIYGVRTQCEQIVPYGACGYKAI
jgi:hypothetical protein